ncbi:MAG: hypothetical protein HOQ11_02570 [Gemmatimonadaceae bacterium]|nr:hypothetical protein [Gemmatimonadaceae bacterium]NUQ92536.1 hypothetical protein [Gemmatimonadaceae bacterium]NUR32736.1 hypothetical protein [Gemmatimonadaceae bacterium]NUS96272.1 hypothetical protein [Gemmatimonadaceae bacterium]
MLAVLEVMDKEPGVIAFWVSAGVLGIIGYLLARRRWWWALPVLILLAVSSAAAWGEWTDSQVGPAIALEAGRFYGSHLLASTILAAGLTIAGMAWPKRAA